MLKKIMNTTDFDSRVKLKPILIWFKKRGKKKKSKKDVQDLSWSLAFIESVRGKRLDGVSFILKETRN